MDAEDWTEFFGILTAEEDAELSWIQHIEDELRQDEDERRREAREYMKIQRKYLTPDEQREYAAWLDRLENEWGPRE